MDGPMIKREGLSDDWIIIIILNKMTPPCKVGSCVYRNYSFLSKLAKTKSLKKKKHLLKNASVDELASIVEIANNIVKAKFNLKPKYKTKLVPYAAPIRNLARKRSIIPVKRILQEGNGFPLAQLLIPVLLEAGRKLIE